MWVLHTSIKSPFNAIKWPSPILWHWTAELMMCCVKYAVLSTPNLLLIGFIWIIQWYKREKNICPISPDHTKCYPSLLCPSLKPSSETKKPPPRAFCPFFVRMMVHLWDQCSCPFCTFSSSTFFWDEVTSTIHNMLNVITAFFLPPHLAGETEERGFWALSCK